MLFLFIAILFILLFLYARYEPKIDIVISKNKYIILLWYNNTEDNCVKRKYLKLFVI